jgi:hypothetical protein
MNSVIKKLLHWARQLFPPEYLQKKPVLFNIESALNSATVSASHSGNIGDVIFSCLFLKAFWQQTGKKIDLHLKTDVPVVYEVKHPLKNILMNQTMANMLVPLLKRQSYIANVIVGPELLEKSTFMLDDFRELPISYRCGLIQGWFQFCTDIWLNVFEPWIEAKKMPEYADRIVVSRTARLRSHYIDYGFLKKYQNQMLFIGLPEEFEQFRKESKFDCQHLTAPDFEMTANILHSSRLFIGNQGFLSTLAEGIKCPRVLESNSMAPNNFPMSSNGRIAIFQEQFERFIESMLSS